MLPELDQDGIQVYAALLRAPHSPFGRLLDESRLGPDTLARSLDLLLVLGLAMHSEGHWTAVDPHAAAGELLDPVEQQLVSRQQAVNRDIQQVRALRRTLADLRPLYSEGRRSRSCDHGPEVLTGQDALDATLLSAAYQATAEVLTVQPSTAPRGPLTLAAVQRDLAVAHRGVRLRSLYQHSARASLALRSHADRLADLGGEVRTMRELFAGMTVFDESVAFLPDPGPDPDVTAAAGTVATAAGAVATALTGLSARQQDAAGTREPWEAAGDEKALDTAPRALVVRDPMVVRHLRGLFQAMWQSAAPVRTEERGYGDAIGELHRTIAQLLAEGLKDETAARRLGLSVRSFRRHVATLSDGLRAKSRFQAGVAAARAGLLHDAPQM